MRVCAGTDAALLRLVLQSLRVISLPASTWIWLAARIADMRAGTNGLAAKVETALAEDPFSGHVFVFRGRRGDMIKVLSWTGDGLGLLAKRLERGRFVWKPVSIVDIDKILKSIPARTSL